MKKIEIQGKHNVDKIKKIKDINYVAKRDCMANLEPMMFEHTHQVKLINQMFLETLEKDYSAHK